jgi:hypothetical protein
MIQKNKTTLLILLAYLGFLLTWGVAQGWAKVQAENTGFWSLLFFTVIHVGMFGLTIPLYIIRRFRIELQSSTSTRDKAIGLGVLTLVLIAGVFLSGSLTSLSSDPPSLLEISKYVFLFVPMALGICLQCFVLIPQIVRAEWGPKSWSSIASIVLAALSIGIAFYVDQLFSNVEDALTMGVLGVFLGIGVQRTRSLPLTYLFFLPIMLVNTLAEGKYFDSPWSPLLIGFAACSLIMFYFIRHQFPITEESHTAV